MQVTSTNFKNKILESSRTFYAAARIGDISLGNADIVSATLETIQNTEGYSIGNTISQSLELTFLNIEATIYTSNQLKMVLGLNTTGSTFENLVMGYFNIDEVEKNDFTTKYTCYDNMIKFETPYITNYGETPTLQQVINDLVRITGVQYNGETLPSYTLTKLEGYTCREVLGFVASICGGNAYINRAGKFAIIRPQTVTYSITGANYIDYKREDTVYKISKVTCYKDKDNYFSKGELGTDSMELNFENPWITETILTKIYNKLNGFEYLGYTMKWQGDISLDIGDVITCTDVKGVTRNLPIFSQKLNFSGGLTSEIGAKGLSKNKNSFSSSGSTSNKVERMAVKQAVIEEALIGKANIQDLTAVDIRTQTLEAKTATIENIIVSKADIADLNTTNATITNLIAEDVRINNLVANKAEITDLNATVGRVGVLESNTADIGTIRANLADIQDLINGNLTSENIQSLVLTSDKVTVQNGFIKNAMIENLDVSKINAGTINTDKFNISSTNGGISIVGATQQFKDKYGNIRIQMGQDTAGNFNFILKGTDGTTTLIDHTGIKEKAIADKLIKTSMVADNAIGEQQLNYSSLITGINKDTNTNFIKSNKVLLNSTNQSLEFAFNEMNSKIEGITTGATNLYKGTRDFNSNYWSGGLPIEAYENDNTCKQATIVSTISLNLTTQTAKQGFDFRDTTKTWTISAMFKGTQEGQTIGLNLSAQRLAWQQQAVTNGEWKKLSWTFTGDGYTLTSFRFTNPSLVGEIKIAQVKVEEGEVATEWTIAPTDITSAIENISTQVNIQQGQIDTAIANTTIINSSGGEVLLKDDYNITKSTVNSNLSTIGTHTTQISNLQTTVNSQGSSITQLQDSITLKVDKTDYESNKTVVDNNISTAKNEAINSAKTYTDANIDTVNTKINTVNSSITQLNNQIALKVEQSNIDSSIKNVVIGGRNYARYSGGTYLDKAGIHPDDRAKASTTIIDNKACLQILNNASTPHIRFLQIPIPEEAVYTFSIWIKGTTNHSATLVHWNEDAPYRTHWFNITTSWAKYSFTFAAKTTRDIVHLLDFPETTYISDWKFEKGTKATDWTPAPEDLDQQIADVSTSIDTKINTAKAEIKQTTDSIALSVTNLQSTTSTLTSQMANKVETSEFKTVKDTQAQLITDLTGITSRVSSVESVTTSNTTVINNVNNKVDTNTADIVTVDTKTNANTTAIANTNTNLNSLTTEYNTTKSTVATHETKITGITSRVSSTESNITTINGTVASQGTRLSTAETKLTDSAFTVQIQKNASKVYKIRYIRDWINGSNINSNNHWVEVQAINSLGVNMASGKIPTSNYALTNPLNITNGGITSAEYSTGTGGVAQYVQIDLGGVYQNIDLIKIWHYYADWRNYHGAKTEVSEDGVNWITVFDSSASGEYAETQYGHIIQLNTNSISTSSTTINEGGLTVKNGAIKIQNKAGTDVFKGDIDGNLSIVGNLTTKNLTNGNKAIELDNTQMKFYDWTDETTRTTPVGIMYSTRASYDASRPGLTMANGQDAFIALSYYDKNRSNYYPYMVFDKDRVYGIDEPNSAIQFRENAYFDSKVLYFGPKGGIYNGGNDILVLNCYEGITLSLNSGSLLSLERNRYIDSVQYGVLTWANTWCNSNLHVEGNFSVKGIKACVEDTENYGEMLSIACESPQAWRFDNYFGVTDENGECLVYMDDVFIEIANTSMDYIVTVQERGEGTLRPVIFTQNWFKVKGTPNIAFSCKVEALRRGDELKKNVRSINLEDEQSSILNQDIFDLISDKEITESKEELIKILDSEIESDLTDILLS